MIILSFGGVLDLSALTIRLFERKVTAEAVPKRSAKKDRTQNYLAFSELPSSLSSTVNPEISTGISA